MTHWCLSVVGMLPHKTERGKLALKRLRAYEGCPPPFDRRKRFVVPGAMRVVCLKPGRKVMFHTSKKLITLLAYRCNDANGNLRLNGHVDKIC